MATTDRKRCSNNCGEWGKLRCSGCKRVMYCGAVCQKADWKRHKPECKFYQREDADSRAGRDMSEQEMQMVAHQKEFQRIVKHYKLDKGNRADKLAEYMTRSDHAKSQITPEMMNRDFGLEIGDAKTFLSWIYIGTRFKEEHIDANAETVKQIRETKTALIDTTTTITKKA